jgi:sugar lactone lactonase YvrE
MRVFSGVAAVFAAVAVAGAGLAAAPSAAASGYWNAAFISRFHKITTIASTVPFNGDLNPYGVAVVSRSTGRLHAGDVLVSNFNNKHNLQGTGTTIVQISPGGQRTLFAHITRSMLPGRCPGGVGLTTALVVLRAGWVIVGSTPSTNGLAATSKAGCLIVLDSRGRVRETIAGKGINGPWDAAIMDRGSFADLFVTNVLNGTVAAGGAVVHRGTVLRLRLAVCATRPPRVVSVTEVGSGFAEQTSVSAFVVGPTGLGLGRGGTLYVADTVANRITAIPDAVTRHKSAGTGHTVTSGGALSGPLGLTIAPNGDVLAVNGGNGKIVETTPGGKQIATRFLDRSGSPPGSGALFGLAIAPGESGVYYVDNNFNTLRLLH